MPEQLVFQLGVTADGKLVWSSRVPLTELNLMLDRVKLDIATGRVKAQAESPIVPATNGDLSALKKRVQP